MTQKKYKYTEAFFDSYGYLSIKRSVFIGKDTSYKNGWIPMTCPFKNDKCSIICPLMGDPRPAEITGKSGNTIYGWALSLCHTQIFFSKLIINCEELINENDPEVKKLLKEKANAKKIFDKNKN